MTGDEVQLVRFRIGPQHFAVNIYETERILRYREPTPLPQAPAFLEGMIEYEGQPVPLLDLRKRLGADAPVRDETRIMILVREGGRLGLVVDAVLEVRKVPAEQIVPPDELVRGLAAAYITGIVMLDGRSVVILATGRLLTSTEQVTLEHLTVEVPHD